MIIKLCIMVCLHLIVMLFFAVSIVYSRLVNTITYISLNNIYSTRPNKVIEYNLYK